MMIKRILVTIIGLLLTLTITTSSAVRAASNKNHPSVVAALECINQIAPIVQNRRREGKDVVCQIPVALSEQDLDEIFKAALRSSDMSEKMRGRAEKYSSLFAKTLTNFRAADCLVKLRIRRAELLDALSGESVVLQMEDQPTTCEVTTKKHKIQQLKFAFSPRIDMENGCIKEFALNMGKIDAGCKVCYFNRLYLSTQIVSLWANHMSGNIKRALNVQLGENCRP